MHKKTVDVTKRRCSLLLAMNESEIHCFLSFVSNNKYRQTIIANYKHERFPKTMRDRKQMCSSISIEDIKNFMSEIPQRKEMKIPQNNIH